MAVRSDSNPCASTKKSSCTLHRHCVRNCRHRISIRRSLRRHRRSQIHGPSEVSPGSNCAAENMPASPTAEKAVRRDEHIFDRTIAPGTPYPTSSTHFIPPNPDHQAAIFGPIGGGNAVGTHRPFRRRQCRRCGHSFKSVEERKCLPPRHRVTK